MIVRTKLAKTADQCVKCGLCLPYCPTYLIRKDEAESPRGRIALIQALADGELEASAKLWSHLTSCLECRACEAFCPSLVEFGSLMDGARSLQKQHSGLLKRWIERIRLRFLSSAAGASAAAALSGLYRSTRLGSLVEGLDMPAGSRLRAYHRVAMQLKRPNPIEAAHTGEQEATREAALFLGCVARSAQPGLPAAACRVLARLGYGTKIPRDQRCCGAMHRHNGFPDDADGLLAQNVRAFGKMQVVVTASACAAELRTHPNLSKSSEICRFLADLEWPRQARLRPAPTLVVVHEPCSHRNVLRDGAAAYDLLRRIPQIELSALEENSYCCGAAGTYLLEKPDMSANLLSRKIEHLRRSNARILVTTNTGCALHLAAGVREAGLDLEVLHPVELIDRHLRD